MAKRKSDTWMYFDIDDTVRKIAICKLCHSENSYKSLSNLKRHLDRKHKGSIVTDIKDEDVQELEEEVEEQQYTFEIIDDPNFALPADTEETYEEDLREEKGMEVQEKKKYGKPKSKPSRVWETYDVISKSNGIARCKLCHKNISYYGATTNLLKHYRRIHGPQSQKRGMLFKQQMTISGPSSSPTKGVRRSPMWDHFTITDDKNRIATCNTCGRNFKYGASSASNLLKHLKSKHCSDVVKNYMSANILEQAVENADVSDVLGVGIPHLSYQNPGLKFQFVNLLIKDFQSMDIIEEKGFLALITNLNPSYKIPSKLELGKMLQTYYENSLTEVKETLQDVESVCLTSEVWTSVMGDYLTIIAHYVDQKFKIKSVLLDCCKYVSLTEQFLTITEDWGLKQKVTSFIVPHVVSRQSDDITLQSSWPFVECYTHMLNLVVEPATQLPVVIKIKSIISSCSITITGSELMLQQFETKLKDLENASIDSSMHWNSIFPFIDDFLAFYNKFLANQNLLTDEEVEICKLVSKILKPFVEVAEEVNRDRIVPASYVLMLTRGLLSSCERLTQSHNVQVISEFVTTIKQGLEHILDKLESNKCIALCTFLDPRFKNHVFLKKGVAERTKSEILELLITIVNKQGESIDADDSKEDDANESIWDEYDTFITKLQSKQTAEEKSLSEINRYLEEKLIHRKENPVLWWQQNERFYPNLAKVQRLKGNLPAACSSCFWNASSLNRLKYARRRFFRPDYVKQIMFLNLVIDE